MRTGLTDSITQQVYFSDDFNPNVLQSFSAASTKEVVFAVNGRCYILTACKKQADFRKIQDILAQDMQDLAAGVVMHSNTLGRHVRVRFYVSYGVSGGDQRPTPSSPLSPQLHGAAADSKERDPLTGQMSVRSEM